MTKFGFLLPVLALACLLVSGSSDLSSEDASLAYEPARTGPEPAPITASPDNRLPDPLSSTRAAAITSITAAKKAGDLEVCVHLDSPANLRESVLNQPSRLVLDFIGVESRVGLLERPVDGPNVRRIRTSQYRASNPSVARVVFDLVESGARNFEILHGNSEVRVIFRSSGRALRASGGSAGGGLLSRHFQLPDRPVASASKTGFSPEEAEDIIRVAESYRSRGNFTGAIGAYGRLLSPSYEPGWICGRILAMTREKLFALEASFNGASGRESLTPPLLDDHHPEGMVWLSIGSRCVVVEKDSQTLLVFRRSAEGLQLEHLYPCSTGTQDGAKASLGDEKTPEGVYSLGRILPGHELADIYGELALPLDYPNSYDVLKGRRGSGIWVHGTDKPMTPYLPRQSRGCIVLSNRDLQELARCTSPGSTPILIVQQLRWQTASVRREETEEFEDFLARWRREAGRKPTDHARVYSTRSRDAATDSKWLKERAEEITLHEDRRRMRSSLQSIVRCGEYAVLAINGDYRNANSPTALKRVFVIRENGLWKILALDSHRRSGADGASTALSFPDRLTR